MWESMAPILFVVFAFGGWVICDVVKNIATNWRQKHESEHQAALKQTLAERGMSADEIVRVVEAGRTDTPAEAGNDELAQLVNKMTKQGKSTDEIERIILAWRGRTVPRKDLESAIRERQPAAV